jgi:hypothetical protein
MLPEGSRVKAMPSDENYPRLTSCASARRRGAAKERCQLPSWRSSRWEARAASMARRSRKSSSEQVPYQPVRGQTVIKSKKEGSEPKGQEFKLSIKTSKLK